MSSKFQNLALFCLGYFKGIEITWKGHMRKKERKYFKQFKLKWQRKTWIDYTFLTANISHGVMHAHVCRYEWGWYQSVLRRKSGKKYKRMRKENKSISDHEKMEKIQFLQKMKHFFLALHQFSSLPYVCTLGNWSFVILAL